MCERCTSEGWTRRRLLSTAGLVGAGLTLSGCRLLKGASLPSPAAPAAPAQSSGPSATARGFEERYGVRLITRTLNADRRLINPDPEGHDLVIDWDDERVRVLDETMRLLPESFYRGRTDRRSGEPLYVHFGLLRQVDQSRSFSIAAETRPYFSTDPVVIFLIGSFPVSARGRAYSRSVIIHELTHKVSNLERTDSYEALFRPTGMRTQADLNRIYASIISRGGSRPTFDSASAYGAYNLEEHGAVASEHYFMGREVFFHGLGPNAVPELGALGDMGYYGYARFLGDDQTTIFYEAFKKNLYEGREYQAQRPL